MKKRAILLTLIITGLVLLAHGQTHAPRRRSPAPFPAPVSISSGRSIDDETGSLGQATKIIDLGAKKSTLQGHEDHV